MWTAAFGWLAIGVVVQEALSLETSKDPFARCSRKMTCDPERCVDTPVLADAEIVKLATKYAEPGKDTVVQFWGDSVTAQAECDFRAAFESAGCTSKTRMVCPNPDCAGLVWARMGSHMPVRDPMTGATIGKCRNVDTRKLDVVPKPSRSEPLCPDFFSASFTCGPLSQGTSITSMAYGIGCPWSCQKGNATVPFAETRPVEELLYMANNDLWNTSVIVFNLGAHYNSENNFRTALEHYHKVLSKVDVKHIVVRSPQATHFATPGGSFSKAAYQERKNSVDCHPRLLQGGTEQAQDKILRKFTANLAKDTTAHVSYLDVLETSNFASMHPQYHSGKKVRDCRHVCQNCKLLRTWSSLLASIIGREELDESLIAHDNASNVLA